MTAISDELRDDLLVQLSPDDLAVLRWFAQWTPEIHRGDWNRRRQWPPGFRYIADTSSYGDHEKYKRDGSYPPILSNDNPRRPSQALGRIWYLLSHRLLEGDWRCARLTARGRAALMLHVEEMGYQPPESFQSHCEEVFDDHNLLPVMLINFDLDLDDKLMGRVPEVYRRANKGDPMPDDEITWRLMLMEYRDGSYRAQGTTNGAYAILTVASGTKALNGSMRVHHSFPTLRVYDERRREVVEISMSFEQLAELLVSRSYVPVTMDSCLGRMGMRMSYPVPEPVSIGRRVRERTTRHRQTTLRWVREVVDLVNDTKMGKKAKAKLLERLSLLDRDIKGEGQFAATLAMEEVSSVAESMMTIMMERAGADRALLPGGQVVTPALLLEGQVEVPQGPSEPEFDFVDSDEEVSANRRMLEDGRVESLMKEEDGTEHWVPEPVEHELILMLSEADGEGDIKLAAAFLKASANLAWSAALSITRSAFDQLNHYKD